MFSIPTARTVNQKFGILIHDVLERFHRDGGEADPGELVGMMESGWARAGLEDSADEVQFRERAREALATCARSPLTASITSRSALPSGRWATAATLSSSR
ncbi:MAG: PD-(D/E)XK nuclease family protein [Solirubrobacterales bacterium]